MHQVLRGSSKMLCLLQGSSSVREKFKNTLRRLNHQHLMLGLATARLSRRYTPVIVKWATYRGIRLSRNTKKRKGFENKTTQSSSILSNLKPLVESADKTEPELPEASPSEPTETLGPKCDPSTLLLQGELTAGDNVSDGVVVSRDPELLEASPPKPRLKYDPSTLPLDRELTSRDSVSEEEYARTLVHGRSVFAPILHPRTHGIPVANIHFRSHHIPLLKLFTHFALHAASSLGIPASNVISLPTQRSLWTVIRSPFAHKKSQENFDRKVHKRAIKTWDADPEVVQRWVSYLRKNAMPGVGMKVTMWDRIPLEIGAMDLNEMDTVENLMLEAPSNIEALGQQIVAEELSKQSESV